MRLPSVKTLCSAFRDLSPEDAELLRRILRKDTRPSNHAEKFPVTLKWVRSCYNPPSVAEVNMSAANELLGLYDAEAVFEDGKLWPWLEYLNTGDIYNLTLCRYNGAYIVASPGYILERDKRAQG